MHRNKAEVPQPYKHFRRVELPCFLLAKVNLKRDEPILQLTNQMSSLGMIWDTMRAVKCTFLALVNPRKCTFTLVVSSFPLAE